MADWIVIYRAQTAPEAYRLKERLEQAGIAAVVEEEQAERQVPKDWALPVPVPVMVDSQRAEQARRIAAEFDTESHRRKLEVIYEARTVPEAQRLKERLAEAGIPAVLGTEIVEGESSADVWGFPEPTRVAVDQDHAEAARRIALALEAEIIDRAENAVVGPSPREQVAGTVETTEPADVVLAGPAVWPRCPDCDTPRLTRCPSCGATGVDLRRAELPAGTTEPRDLVICPECDEPFEPRYARQCQVCAHAFPEGYEPRRPTREMLTQRILLALGGLVVVIGGSLAYFAWVLHHGR